MKKGVVERKEIIPFHAMIWPTEMLGYKLNPPMNKIHVKIYSGMSFVRPLGLPLKTDHF